MEKDEVYRALEGRRMTATAVQAGEAAAVLLLSAAAVVATGYIRMAAGRYRLPFQMIAVALLCLIDLTAVTPIKGEKHMVFRRIVTGEGSHVSYRKAISLRIRLWRKRVCWWLAAGVLPAWLYAVPLGGAPGMLRDLTAASFLICGVFLGELYLLRYAAAWYLLPDCSTVGEALKRSVQITRGRRGEYLWVCCCMGGWGLGCLFLLPALYTAPMLDTARALWIRNAIRNPTYKRARSR